MHNRLLNWYYVPKKGRFVYPFTIRNNNNKTGFNNPLPDFIQKECHGWRETNWEYDVSIYYGFDHIYWKIPCTAAGPASTENTYPEVNMPCSASKCHNKTCLNMPPAGLNWKLLSCVLVRVCACMNVWVCRCDFVYHEHCAHILP